jgi:valyl-tRNA synthetase
VRLRDFAALQITPGHDPNDYAIGKRRDLAIINIMNKDGSMNAAAGASSLRHVCMPLCDRNSQALCHHRYAGAYAGLSREDCRKKLWVRASTQQVVVGVRSLMALAHRTRSLLVSRRT